MANEYQTRLKETGRNDVCPCGSGRKYKKCHLAEDQSAQQVAMRAEQVAAEAAKAAEQAAEEANGEAGKKKEVLAADKGAASRSSQTKQTSGKSAKGASRPANLPRRSAV